MGIQYRCENKNRRQILHDSTIALNGIDYLEVLDQDAPEAATRQRTLLVRMLKPVPSDLVAGNVQIKGGVRVTAVRVLWVLRAADASGSLAGLGVIEDPPTEAERDFLRTLPQPDRVLVVRTNTDGDFSTYSLHLVKSSTDPAPPDGFDPILSQVAFSFKVECPSGFDCLPDEVCPPETVEEPPIDYLAKDYASFRQLMLDRLSVVMPDWQERSPADLGIAVVEVLAYAADYLSYYQDAVATEAYLGRARRRTSVRRHARLLDYPMHDGCNARAWIHVTVGADLTMERSTPLLTQVTGHTGRIAPDSPAYRQALSQQPIVFETMHKAALFEAHNKMPFYTWGDEACCLPKGATRATLKGHFPNLKPGYTLIFLEERGSESGKAADADLAHRHAVRLTAVRPAEDRLGGQILDPKNTDPVLVTEIAWHPEDALPFPLCLKVVKVPAEEQEPGVPAEQPVSVALGNVVLADHGRTVADEELEEWEPVPEVGRYRPHLDHTDITHCTRCGSDDDVLQDLPASALLVQDPCRALPAVSLKDSSGEWKARRDLLASDRFAAEFVVEVESDGRASLRFGDGVYGRRPTADTKLVPSYRVGNGQRGNVGADAIGHVVSSDDGILVVRNPLPAQGGTAPESIEEVRLYAPQAFRTQERAVTEEDYAQVAQRHTEVQKAMATRRWTGSWYTMFLTVDRKGGLAVDADFEVRVRAFLERFRLAGQDLEIDGPSFVPLDIAFTVCVAPDYFRSKVKQALLETFSNRQFPGGWRGFFHPDNFTFSQPVYLSQMVAAAMQVSGVRWVDAKVAPSKPNRFKRWGQPQRDEFEKGQIDIGRLEIARLDNDPNAPENGKIEFFMEGGL